ncbi:MAG: hypothetical protein ACYCPQ_07360, partial [Elusimicrobiota bacterium]
MENNRKTPILLALLGAGLCALSLRAHAASPTNPAVLNIDVTITASKSVVINGVALSTDSASVSWSGVA